MADFPEDARNVYQGQPILQDELNPTLMKIWWQAYRMADAFDGGAGIAATVSISQATPGVTNGVQVNAALPAGNNNIGDVDVASIAAGDNNIGNVDIVTLPALVAGTASIGGTKDNGPQWTPTRTYTTSADMSTAAAISPAPTGGQKLVATDIIVSTDTAMNFSIQEETSATVFAKVYLAANTTAQITLRSFLKTAVADKKFFGKASVSGNVAITCITYSEA